MVFSSNSMESSSGTISVVLKANGFTVIIYACTEKHRNIRKVHAEQQSYITIKTFGHRLRLRRSAYISIYSHQRMVQVETYHTFLTKYVHELW